MSDKDRVESAVSCFQAGHSCSQAIFSVYARDTGMDEELAMRVSSGFGGGIARTGHFCGAVTGAVMVIGLHHGSSLTDEQSKERNYAVVRAFLEEFGKRNGSLSCRDLLGYDVGTGEGRRQIKERLLTKTVCPRLVRDAAEILEGILADGR